MEITNEIQSICADLLQRYKDEINKTGHSATGDLANTASYKCKFDGKWFEVTFSLKDYWKYLENGTKPHFPPIDAIEKWIIVKRIIPSTSGKNVPSTKQLAYLIARGISINGTKPTKLLQKTIDDADDLINLLLNEITAQLENEVNKELEETIKQ